jgi:hypothetical protein
LLTKFVSLSHAEIFWFFLDYFHFGSVFVFAATPQRHRQADNLEVPPAASFSRPLPDAGLKSFQK